MTAVEFADGENRNNGEACGKKASAACGKIDKAHKTSTGSFLNDIALACSYAKNRIIKGKFKLMTALKQITGKNQNNQYI